MLQGSWKHLNFCLLLWLSAAISSTGCKPEASSVTDERADYLADYEEPNQHWGFIDTSGHVAILPRLDEVGQFSEGKVAANKGGLWGYLDKEGKVVIPFEYKSAYAFHDNRARVQDFNNHECYIDHKGHRLESKDWEAAGDFSEGLARIRTGNTYGYMDTAGTVVIKPVYSRAGNFKDGLAKIEFQGKKVYWMLKAICHQQKKQGRVV